MKEICQHLYDSYLWKVEIDPCLQLLRNKIETAVDALSELLPASENHRFLKLDDLQMQLEDILCRTFFESGYHLGLRVASEALVKEDCPDLFKNE